MINKLSQKGILIICLLMTLTSYGGNEKLMNYLKGSDIGAQLNVPNSLTIINQQFAGFFVPPVNNAIKSSYVTTALRYEESLLPIFNVGANTINDNFSVIITYSIELTDHTSSTATFTSQTLKIDYDKDSDTYSDVEANRYFGYLEGKITITNIDFKIDGVATFVYTDFPTDLYLELSSEVERYYELQNPVSWINPHFDNTAKNELAITWDYVLGAESFDLEWVFVDITPDPTSSPAQQIADIEASTIPYDWKNATRINTTNNNYNISLGYPMGMIIYRVRPVGVDIVNGGFKLTKPGDWSYAPTILTPDQANTDNYGFAFKGLGSAQNWTYNVAYAEDGKRKEGISYFDGSARSRQEVTILNSDQNAIIGETMYDFEGRPAVSMLPTPVVSDGIGFYENATAGEPFNDGYTKTSFDRDFNFLGTNGPDAMSTTVGASATNDYYSTNIPSTSLYKDYIPDAEDFPFSRTTYKSDGTDRIVEQSGVGPSLMHGTANTTKYYYGTPSNMEIERLFGNEVGPAAFYQKNMVVDPNGQVSIQYLDKEGRTIATSLAGNVAGGDPLLDIDYKPTSDIILTNLLSSSVYTTDASKSTYVLPISTPSTTVDFNYDLTPESFASCVLTNPLDPQSSPVSFKCSYELNIKILDQDGADVLGGTHSYIGDFNGTVVPAVTLPISFSHNFLKVGTYTIVKTLTIDNIKRQDYVQDFNDYIINNLTDQLCVPYEEPLPVDCDNSCDGFCEEAYRALYYDENSEQNEYAYYDINGVALPPTYDGQGEIIPDPSYAGLVATCKLECAELPLVDICETNLKAMKIQLSPGGQYFDNLKTKYLIDPNTGLNVVDGNGQPIVNNSVLPSTFTYDIDGWLEAKFGIDPSSPTTPFTSSLLPGTILNTYNTWDQVRNDWANIPGLIDELIKDHPEICAYRYYCFDATPCGGGNGGSVPISEIIGYGQYMENGHDMAHSELERNVTGNPNDYMDFLNPFGTANNANPLPANLANYINEVSNPGVSLDDPVFNSADFLADPLFDVNGHCSQLSFWDGQAPPVLQSAKTWVENFLKNFVDAGVGTPHLPAFHSIWYVMDDPGVITIHTQLTAAAAGVNQPTFDLYNRIHGNPNPTVIDPVTSLPFVGILDNTGADPTKQNKHQFFRGIYKFYRDYVRYQIFKHQTFACSGSNAYSYWNPDVSIIDAIGVVTDWTSYNATRDQDITASPANEDDGFELVWPRNSIFDMFDPQNPTPMQTIITNTIFPQNCVTECENNALAWMDEYLPCTNAAVLSQLALDNLKADLISICSIGCNANPPPANGLVGSSTGDGGTTSIPSTKIGGGGAPLYNFQEVIDHHIDPLTCSENVVYPNPVTNFLASTRDCHCQNLEDYGVNILLLTVPFDATERTTIATALTTLTGVTYIAADVLRWLDYCDDEVGDIIDLPETLECTDCKCEQLELYITSRPVLFPSYDPFALILSEANIVAAEIDADFGANLLTGQNIIDMMAACGTPSTLNPHFVNLPNAFRCNANLEITDPGSDCADELNNDNLQNYLTVWNQQFQAAIGQFEDDYTIACMNNILTRETFTAEYSLNEFMYTLYYYDQAGNLIKTVPPEGVIPNTTGTGTPFVPDPFFAAVADHRSDPHDPVTNPGGEVHQNVLHTLTTQYKYDSYNNLISQSTPDGGTTNFWYDKLGRLVLSQNAKQDVASGNTYSYTLYDPLGRIYEVGEIESTTEIDDEYDDYTGAFIPWVTDVTAIRREVTKTFYDESLNATVASYFGNGQNELRTRVSSILREEIFDATNLLYDYGTHFSYDIHGNVNEIIQENRHLTVSASPETRKKITYEYDLISGNVNKVSYQPGRADQFYHRYCYDADNRITKVETSRDNYIWDTDAKYFYYEHGPLARCEIGEKHVAGTDYTYTLQGWLKGVNSNTLKTNRDVGKDANLTAANLNQRFGTDAYGYSLGYFDGDYQPATIPAALDNFLADISGSDFETASPSLYNGNIRHMVTNLLDINEVETTQPVHGVAYRYDQANRIRNSNVFSGVTNNDFLAATDNGKYETEHHYDLNGNITELLRKDNASDQMDDMKYKYANNENGYQRAGSSGYTYADGTVATPPVWPNLSTNQLTQVIDNGVGPGPDFTGTGTQNYLYDPIGQLTADASENIDAIKWDVYNKIEEIQYTGNHEDIAFKYDASGNRVAKILKFKDGSNNVKKANHWHYYYYDRDASGNIMAVYKEVIVSLGGNSYRSDMELIEKDIYGSSRIGTDLLKSTTSTLFSATFTTLGGTTVAGTQDYSNNKIVEVNSDGGITITDESMSDINVTVKANANDLSLYIPSSYTVNGGSSQVAGDYILGANQTAVFQIDDYTFTAYPNGKGAYFSPNGGITLKYSTTVPLSYNLPAISIISNYARTMGEKVYEKSNHLGNVLVTLSDRKFPAQTTPGGGNTWDYYEPDVLSYSDYYPFGSLMPGRYASSGDYRYGFIGQENDNEVYNVTGGSQYHGFRSYDTRLGRYKSVDPLSKRYPHNSPFAYAENKVISGIDLEGLEYYYTADGKLLGKLGKSLEVRVVKEKDVKRVMTGLVFGRLFGFTGYVNKLSSSLGVDNNVLVAFAAVIDEESGGNKEESYAIGNVTTNYIENGGSSQLKTLEDVVLYDNTFAQGARKGVYDNFVKLSPEEQNRKYGLGAAINAVGYQNDVKGYGFIDYSNGADGWDGIDLVSTKWSNSHRNWTWSSDSKSILEQYKKERNGGVNVSGFGYKKSGFDISAKKIIGKTVYTKIHTGRGERKQSKARFD